MYQLANQPAFDPLLLLLASSAISNPQSRRTVTENKRLSHFILIDGTTPLLVNTAIRAKSALYAVKLDVGLQTTQKMKGTEKYVNISLILRAVTVILRMQAKKIRELLTSILI